MCHYVSSTNWLDIAYKIATVLIATFNIVFAIYIFNSKNRKEASNLERERKISWLKTLILDYNLEHFYAFFDNLEVELTALKQPGLNDVDKQGIYSKSQDHFITLRRKFIDSLLAIDANLYYSILKSADDLQTILSSVIFDNGINLSHIPKFEEVITEKISTSKTEIIKKLFEYRG